MMHIAQAAARKSTMKPQVGAVVVRGGRVLGVGFNSEGYSKRTPGAWSRHAEVQACLNVDVRGATVFVYRAHGLTGGPMLARPCLSCWEFMRQAQVRRAVWTAPGGRVLADLS